MSNNEEKAGRVSKNVIENVEKVQGLHPMNKKVEAIA